MLAPLDHCCCCCLLPCTCTSCSGLTRGGGRGVMTAPVRDRVSGLEMQGSPEAEAGSSPEEKAVGSPEA
eukprot:1522605-Rhodomonas_salina.1